jgi:hypothetical protein
MKKEEGVRKSPATGTGAKAGWTLAGLLAIGMSFAAFLAVTAIVFRYGLQMLDDGYYYLQTAWNLSRGLGFTFDGINQTNGFHPLWQVALVPVFWLIGSKATAAVVITLLQTALFAGAGLLIYRLVRELSGDPWMGLLGAALWLFDFWFWSKGALSGMETGLLVFMYGACLISFISLLRSGRGAWATGTLLALACAARLDTIALACGVFIVLLLARRGRQAWATLMPPAGFIAVYLVLNRILFGGAVPISGYIKTWNSRLLLEGLIRRGDLSIAGHALANLKELFSLGGRLPESAAMVLAAGLLAATALLIARARPPLREVAGVHASYMLLMLGYYSLMYDSLLAAYTYYWYPAIYGVLAIVVALVAGIGSRPARAACAAAMLTLLAGFDLVYGADRLQGYSFVIPWEERPDARGVEFLNDSLGEGAVIGCWDAGYVGYFCLHPVVNLDGLVNNYRFQRILGEQGLAAYLDTMGITHLANVDYFLGTREMIRDMLGWRLVFEDSSAFPNPVSIFSLSSGERQYAGQGIRAFYVFERP